MYTLPSEMCPTKLQSNVAVDTDLIAWVKGETSGIDRQRTVTVIRLKDGSALRINEYPSIIIDKLGLK